MKKTEKSVWHGVGSSLKEFGEEAFTIQKNASVLEEQKKSIAYRHGLEAGQVYEQLR